MTDEEVPRVVGSHLVLCLGVKNEEFTKKLFFTQGASTPAIVDTLSDGRHQVFCRYCGESGRCELDFGSKGYPACIYHSYLKIRA